MSNIDSDSIQLAGIEQRTVAEQNSDQQSLGKEDLIASEVPVAFSYNGMSHAVMMASPIDLNDFAIGFSITERIVDSAEQILNIQIDQAKLGFTVQIQIESFLLERLDQQRRQMSGRSGCGICGISDLAAAIPKLDPLDKLPKPEHQVIASAIETFQAAQSLQQQCGAVHCAGLFDKSASLLCLREDIGRHNALDKLIGAQLNSSERGFKKGDFLILSSRGSHELITKAVIAGVNSLVTISAATTLAIDMASKLNLNLIGFVRGQRQLVYHQNS